MFLTRIDEECQVAVDGDVPQSDLRGSASGLATMLRPIERDELPVPVIEFGLYVIVRSSICAQWVRAFTNENRRSRARI